MLDMKWIRNHQEQVTAAVKHKGVAVSIEQLLKLDEARRGQRLRVDALRASRNTLSAEIAERIRHNEASEAEKIKEQVRCRNAALAEEANRLRELDQAFNELMLLVPNVVSPDTPVGKTDADNVVVKIVGEPPQFPFEPKDHVALGEDLDLLDIPRGVKVAGTRNYYLKGMGVQLHRAVQQLALDVLTDRGFTAIDVPLMVSEASLIGSGFFPGGKDQTYEIAGEGKWLVGTSEAPLVAYFSDEILDLSKGPIRLAGISNCFRKEAGSAGRDVRGLYRVHQFAKVEQVVICEPNLQTADEMLRQMTENAEDILRLLELPYRVTAVCTGDMGAKNYKQYDIETWMPSRSGYGETHSSSSLLDFQARRCGIRYRNEEGQLLYVYTLNNTAVATPRILIPLLENHQQPDGSIYIPTALRPYLRGAAEIRKGE